MPSLPACSIRPSGMRIPTSRSRRCSRSLPPSRRSAEARHDASLISDRSIVLQGKFRCPDVNVKVSMCNYAAWLPNPESRSRSCGRRSRDSWPQCRRQMASALARLRWPGGASRTCRSRFHFALLRGRTRLVRNRTPIKFVHIFGSFRSRFRHPSKAGSDLSHTPVDGYFRTGGKTALVARKEEGGCRYLIRSAHTPERYHTRQCVSNFL